MVFMFFFMSKQRFFFYTFFIRRGVHPFLSRGAGGGTMGPLSRNGNREADGSKKLFLLLPACGGVTPRLSCLESACVSGSQCAREAYLHVCLLHPACAALIHPTLFLRAGRYMSRRWGRQRCPALSRQIEAYFLFSLGRDIYLPASPTPGP